MIKRVVAVYLITGVLTGGMFVAGGSYPGGWGYVMAVLIVAACAGAVLPAPIWGGVGIAIALSSYVAFRVFVHGLQPDETAFVPLSLAFAALLGTAAAAGGWGVSQVLTDRRQSADTAGGSR